MPNGGSDCCGTCWFNRTNRGERNWQRHADPSVQPHCEIRNVAIDDPFYTYCANHPHRRPERDPIPIGPIWSYGGESVTEEADRPGHYIVRENPRVVWKPSPDSEAIRQHLLDLLASVFEHMAVDWYPIGGGVEQSIMWQLGEFGEPRAVRNLEWIRDNCPDEMAATASEALAKICTDE